MNIEEIKNSKKIIRFINSIRSKNSRVRYEYFIKEFFFFVNENPDTYLVDDYEFLELIDKKKIASRYKNNLQDFKNKLLNEPNKHGRSNKEPSIRTSLSCIKSLFTYCGIDFPKTFWQNLNNFRNVRTSLADTPTSEQLRKILDHTDIQGKCIFLIMATSGSRIDSVIQLRKKHIDMDHDFPRIFFSYETVKSGITKVKRVSPECKRFLESYFTNNAFTPDSKLFRMTRQNADYKWKCALTKAGLYKKDENTGRVTMTTHCLKRFFMTNFGKANFGNNEQWANYFGEHISDLDRRYKDYDDKFIDEQYSKGVQFLLVYERAYDTDSRIAQLQKERKEDKGTIKVLTDKVSRLDNSLEDIERQKETMEQNHEKDMENLKEELKNLKSLILKNSHEKDELLCSGPDDKPYVKSQDEFVDVSDLEWKTEKLTKDIKLTKVKK